MTIQELEYAKKPKCICPFCKGAILTSDSKSCPKCQTVFTANEASWRLAPIDNQQQTEILRLAALAGKSLAEFEIDLLKNLTKN